MWQELKNIYHFFQALFWRTWYGFPDRSLHIYGVTGTNGKTTTSYILSSIFKEQFGADKVGMLTTVAFRVGGTEEPNATKMTTLPSRLVYHYLRRMKKAGVTHVVLEMTSHALDQHRLYGISLDGAIILNIEREHLDYHHTMEDYASAKAKIINYLKRKAPLIGKGDDHLVQRILMDAQKQGVSIVQFSCEKARLINTPLKSEVNQENALAAKLLAKAVGVSDEAIDKGIASLLFVPGRMQWIEAPQGFKVLIDYAVTPDALERLYSFVKSDRAVRGVQGKIYAILGAAGKRDRGKRAAMAHIVRKYTDFLVITREDPWTESEEQIFTDLEKGLDKADPSWKRIVDRKEALKFLIAMAKPEDIIVATGKGAEMGMGIGRKVVPWSEQEVIRELLSSL